MKFFMWIGSLRSSLINWINFCFMFQPDHTKSTFGLICFSLHMFVDKDVNSFWPCLFDECNKNSSLRCNFVLSYEWNLFYSACAAPPARVIVDTTKAIIRKLHLFWKCLFFYSTAVLLPKKHTWLLTKLIKETVISKFILGLSKANE